MPFKYMVVSLPDGVGNQEVVLNRHGDDGWLLVNVVGTIAYMMSEVPSQPDAQPPAEIHPSKKPVETVTNQEEGLRSPPHRHQVRYSVDRGVVVPAQTDMVAGHAHSVIQFGVTEEADGHTHTFGGEL